MLSVCMLQDYPALFALAHWVRATMVKDFLKGVDMEQHILF